MLKSARELKSRELAEQMIEMARVNAIPGVHSREYYDATLARYQRVFNGAVQEYSTQKSGSSGSIKLSWEEASQQMIAAAKLKRRLECGR